MFLFLEWKCFSMSSSMCGSCRRGLDLSHNAWTIKGDIFIACSIVSRLGKRPILPAWARSINWEMQFTISWMRNGHFLMTKSLKMIHLNYFRFLRRDWPAWDVLTLCSFFTSYTELFLNSSLIINLVFTKRIYSYERLELKLKKWKASFETNYNAQRIKFAATLHGLKEHQDTAHRLVTFSVATW